MNSPSSHHHPRAEGARTAVETVDGRVTDPVCGMQVDPATTPHHATHDGAAFHFCSERCRAKFVDDPQRWLSPRDEPEVAQPGAIYTWPMHPEVRQEGPGTYPFCGMALEPEMPNLEDDDNPELRDFSRRFWGTLPLPVVTPWSPPARRHSWACCSAMPRPSSTVFGHMPFLAIVAFAAAGLRSMRLVTAIARSGHL